MSEAKQVEIEVRTCKCVPKYFAVYQRSNSGLYKIPLILLFGCNAAARNSRVISFKLHINAIINEHLMQHANHDSVDEPKL